MSLILFVTLPLLASFLTPLFRDYLKYVSLALHTSLLLLAFSFIGTLPITETISFDSPLSISFVLDSASLFFVILFISIMILFLLYQIKESMSREIFILTNMLIASVSGLVLSGDIFNIYIFFEIASITAYILTSLNRDKKAYSGAIRYMIMGSIASIFLLMGIMSIYLNIGSLSLVTIADKFSTIASSTQILILISLFIGFGIKAEVFPLNFWVVDIYQASSNRVNALFSSILSKAYIFLFFHIAYMLHVDQKLMWFLATMGVISFAVAELSALSSRDTKRIFAYSTLGQIGVLFIALSSGDQKALTGAFFLIVLHSITKLMLFLSLDILNTQFGSSKIDIFSRFRSTFLVILFAIGFLSLLGIPPLGGFIAKIAILEGLAYIQSYYLVGAILIVSLVEAVYFFRLLGLTQKDTQREPVVISLYHKIILGSMALSIVYLGLFPESLLAICQSVASSLLGAGHV